MDDSDIQSGRINDQLGTQLESLSAQVEANLERGRTALAEWQTLLRERTSEIASQTDDLVHTRPWEAAGVALAAGFVLGLLLGRD